MSVFYSSPELSDQFSSTSNCLIAPHYVGSAGHLSLKYIACASHLQGLISMSSYKITVTIAVGNVVVRVVVSPFNPSASASNGFD